VENQRTRGKTLASWREPTTNSTHIWHRAGIEPGPKWWEASVLTTALTTAPSLLALVLMVVLSDPAVDKVCYSLYPG